MQAGNIQKPLLCVAAGAHAGRGILYMTGLHKSSGRGYANGYAISMRPETAVVRIQPAVDDLAHPDFTVTEKKRRGAQRNIQPIESQTRIQDSRINVYTQIKSGRRCQASSRNSIRQL